MRPTIQISPGAAASASGTAENNLPDQGRGSTEYPRSLVMVCLSPSPSSKRVIRAAARMALVSASAPIALYVGSSGREADEDSRLRENIQYARDRGFEVHTARGSDIPLAISEYARREGVTDLFLGYSPPSFIFQAKPAINDKLLAYLPTVDIHIIPDPVSSPYAEAIKNKSGSPGAPVWNLGDLLLVLGVMTVATLLSAAFYVSRYSNSNIITIYILGVLIASVMTSSRVYGIFAAVLYVLLFNFLFIILENAGVSFRVLSLKSLKRLHIICVSFYKYKKNTLI